MDDEPVLAADSLEKTIEANFEDSADDAVEFFEKEPVS